MSQISYWVGGPSSFRQLQCALADQLTVQVQELQASADIGHLLLNTAAEFQQQVS